MVRKVCRSLSIRTPRYLTLRWDGKVGRDPLKAKKSKSRTVPKKFERGDRFCKCSKSFWLKQGLEPVTAGCTVNRLKSLLKSGTYTMRSVLTRKKRKNIGATAIARRLRADDLFEASNYSARKIRFQLVSRDHMIFHCIMSQSVG